MPSPAGEAPARSRVASLPPAVRFLAALARSLERARTPEEVAENALALLADVAGVRWLTITRVSDNVMRPVAQAGEAPPGFERYVALLEEGLPRGVGASWRALEEGEAVFLEAYEASAGPHALLAPDYAGALAYLPLGGETGAAWGVLGLATREEHGEWEEGAKAALDVVAGLVAAAVERAVANESERRQAKRLRAVLDGEELLASLASALHSAATPDDVAEVAVQRLGPALNAHHAVLWRVDGTQLRLKKAWGVLQSQLGGALRGEPVPLSRLMRLRAVVESGEAYVTAEDTVEESALTGDLPPVYVAIEPVRVTGEERYVSALLVITREARNGAFSLEERLLIERAATVVGLALERARDRQALLARNSALETVVSLLRELREDSQPFELAGRALESCLERLPRGVVIYYESEGGMWRARVWRGDFGNSYLTAVQSGVRLQDTPVGRSVLESGRPEYIEESTFDPRRAGLDYEDGYRIVSTATLPVFVAGQVRGVIGLGLYEQHDWSAADRALLETTATGLGIAIERSEAMERLAVQTRELRERNAEQDAFIYTVSHDLRGPLIAIEGMAALLNETVSRGDGAEAAFLAGRVSANVARMTQLLDDLLTLSRVGRAGESPVPVDLGTTFASVLTDLDARVRARGVRVAAEGAWPSVLYPPSEAYQVLLNLVGNAVKFAGRDGLPPQVLVRCHHEGERVTVTVEDNGPGIPAAFRERVFALFQKVNAKAEGTGVGLAIVKRVAERHGGDAWVEDSALGGAAFRVTMPVAQLD